MIVPMVNNDATHDEAAVAPGSTGSAEHVLAILEAYDDSAAELGVADLARRVCLPRSTVHRILKVLEGRRFVVQNPASRKYRLGWKLFGIGSLVVRQTNVAAVAHPFAEAVALETGEVVHVSIFDDGEVVQIDRVESPQTVYVRSWIGQRAPAHATAGGKVLLAGLDDAALQRLLGRKLRAYTANTITDRGALLRELADVRARGYATNRGELTTDAVGVAAPLRDYSGRLVGALGLLGPTSRLGADDLPRLAAVVCRAARAASADLGWLPAAAPRGPAAAR
jgi:DNA-binding IclR family transcriptional regulator